MKIRIEPSPDCEIKVDEDDDGNIIGIDITPFFAKKNGQCTVAYGTARSDSDKLLERFSLVVSAKTGQFSKQGRREHVKAAVDEEDPAEASE